MKVVNEVNKTRSFILGGRSEFTIENLDSKTLYRYKVTQSRDNCNLFFVRVKTENGWQYAGFLNTEGNGQYIKGNKGAMEAEDPSIKGVLYALRKGDSPLPRPMVLYHHGRCACCGRKLMDLESTQRGFGPKCWKNLFGGT